jgi:hypothetical protein
MERDVSSSLLLPKNVKFKIYKIIILPAVLYGCETWSLILRDEHRLRVFKIRVLRGIFEQKGMKLLEVGENCIMRNFITCTLHQI